MLNPSADNMRLELEAAIDLRKQYDDFQTESIARYAGPDYRKDWDLGADMHENHNHELAANLVPKLAYSNPTIDLDSMVLPPEAPQIQALSFGMNAWCNQTNLVTALTAIATDVCLGFGVTLIDMQPVPGYDGQNWADQAAWNPMAQGDGPPVWPRGRRIDRRRFFTDPQATDAFDFRFRGHIWIRDKEDLLKAKDADGRPRFDAEMVKQLTEDTGLEEIGHNWNGYAHRHAVARRQVLGYEFFMPETGMLYCLGYTQTSNGSGRHGYLCEPRRYFGPATGGYVLWGVWLVPNQVYPLSPCAVTSSLVREINAHAGQASEDAASAKRLIMVNAENKTIQEGIRSYLNGTVMSVPGFNGQFAQVELGGAQPANLNHLALLRERLDRQSALSDTRRGNPDPNTTARAETIAETAAQGRDKFAQRVFRDRTIDMLKIVGWLMNESSAVRFPCLIKDPVTGRKIPKVFIGGPQPGVPHIPFEMMMPRISPYSMELVDDAVLQRRAQSAFATATTIVGAALQNPALKVRELANDMFEAINIRDGGERYIDFEALEAMRGAGLTGAPGSAPGAVGPDGGGTGDELSAILAEAAAQ